MPDVTFRHGGIDMNILVVGGNWNPQPHDLNADNDYSGACNPAPMQPCFATYRGTSPEGESFTCIAMVENVGGNIQCNVHNTDNHYTASCADFNGDFVFTFP